MFDSGGNGARWKRQKGIHYPGITLSIRNVQDVVFLISKYTHVNSRGKFKHLKPRGSLLPITAEQMYLKLRDI